MCNDHYLMHGHAIAHVRHLKEPTVLHSARSLSMSTSIWPIRVPEQHYRTSYPRVKQLSLPSTSSDLIRVNRPAPVSCVRVGNASFLCSPLDLRCYRKGVVLEEFQQLYVLKIRDWHFGFETSRFHNFFILF